MARRAYDTAWQRKLHDAGYAGVAWPKAFGGQGLPVTQQLVYLEEYARADAPYIGVCFVGMMHAGPTLIAEGTDEQRAYHLPRILRGETHLVPGLLRARGRVRPRLPADPRRARGRRVRRERPEDLEHPSPRRRLVRAAGAHRPRRVQAPGHHLAHPRHAPARRRGAADAHHRRREPLLRGVPHRRPGPGHEPGRRGERRLAGHQRHAALRAGHRLRPAHHHDAVPAARPRRPGP